MTCYDFLLTHLPLDCLRTFAWNNGISYRRIKVIVGRAHKSGLIRTWRLPGQGRPLHVELTTKGKEYVKHIGSLVGLRTLDRSAHHLVRSGLADR